MSFKLLGSGAFADVYDLGDGTVVKVFRRVAHTAEPVRSWDDHDFLTWFVCSAERVAYERVSAVPSLEAYIPQYLGSVDHEALGVPASPFETPYVAGAAFRLEKIPGTDIKIAHVDEEIQASVETIVEQIRDVAGRVHVWDCSCFIPGTRAPFAVIDFAYPDGAFGLSDYLAGHGTIPEELRRRASRFAGIAEGG